jgi:hypothetical protein
VPPSALFVAVRGVSRASLFTDGVDEPHPNAVTDNAALTQRHATFARDLPRTSYLSRPDVSR